MRRDQGAKQVTAKAGLTDLWSLIGNLIPPGGAVGSGGEGVWGGRGRFCPRTRLHETHCGATLLTQFAVPQQPEDRPRAFQAQYTPDLGTGKCQDRESDGSFQGTQGRSGGSNCARWRCSRKSGSTSGVMPGSRGRTGQEGRTGPCGARGGARGGGSCLRPQCSRILRITFPWRASINDIIFMVPPHWGHWSGSTW